MSCFRKPSTILLIGMVLLSTGCHPWFKSTFPWETKTAANQPPTLVNSSGETSRPGIPADSFNDCMKYGGTRRECNDALPPEASSNLKNREVEHGTMRRQQVSKGYALNEGGGYLNFGFALIKLPTGWQVDFERSHGSGQSKVISVRNPNDSNLLQIQSLVAPDTVKQETLRNMTNVDASVSLPFESWGDYKGFQHNYTEGDRFFRQWWIAHDRNLVLINYQSQTPLADRDIEQLAEVVRSLRKIPSGNASE